MGKDLQRRISISLPSSLIEEIDDAAKNDKYSRSEIVALAMRQYLRERRRIELKKEMASGYRNMGSINLSIAEKSFLSDECAYKIYEDFLSESEKCDSKTR
ncbi:MAG: ribbon-helix-helix protein, CopG family [Clostridia bacterium]|nr:ribbon-helix-helix protein, CopG family [Clostridia bacterium]